MKKYLLLLCSFFILTSCLNSKSENSSKKEEEIQCKVELFNCEGVLIKTWISSGYVKTVSYSDVFRFWDSKEQKEVRISGTVVVTKQ
jgi:hypothetical protein